MSKLSRHFQSGAVERSKMGTNKLAVLFFMAASCSLGCKNMAPLDLVEPQELPSPVSKPSDRQGTVAWKCQMDTWDSTRPVDGPKPHVAKADHAEKRRVASMAGKLKPAGPPKKDVGQVGTSPSAPASVPLTGIPRDVWYAIATIFGAVFTSVLAPIAVEIIRERMAISRQQTGKQQNGTA